MPDDVELIARKSLPEWGFPADAALVLLNHSENVTYRVADADRTAILRLHRPEYHSEAAIRSELAWIDALRRDVDLVAPVPVPTVGGEVLVRVADTADETRHAVLFDEIAGAEPAPDDLDRHLPLLGRLAATFHAHVESWCPPEGFTRFRWSAPELLGEQARWGALRGGLGVDAEVYSVLSRAAEVVVQRLTAFGTEAGRFGLIHADMRLANLLVDGDSVAVIDFDDSGYSWHLYDLAATLSFIEHDPRVPQWCAAWLESYHQVRPLATEERAMVGTFVLLRRLVLVAWLGTHSEIPLAGELGADFAVGAAELAEQYLGNSGWLGDF